MSYIQSDILEALLSTLPNASQIKDIDLSSPDTVRFAWRGTRFRVSGEGGFTEEVGDGVLICSNQAELMGALVHRGLALVFERRQKEAVAVT